MNTAHFFILGNLHFMIGVILLLGGVFTWLRAHRKYSTWKSVSGMITKVVSHSISPANFHYYPVIEFQTQTGKIVSYPPILPPAGNARCPVALIDGW